MKVIDDVPKDLWDQVVARCNYATFFHTSTWAEILAQTYPTMDIFTKGFALDDGVVAIVPLVGTTERNRYFKWYESIYPGSYGGPVAERNLTQTEINYIFEHLPSAHTAYLHVMGNPYTLYDPPPSYRRSQLSTQVLSLVEGFDAISKGIHKHKRRRIKKAREMGVEVGVAQTEEEFRSYYEVYEDSLRRWGDSTLISYPYALFEQICRCGSDGVRLWIAEVDDEIISGNVNFYHNRYVIAWHQATRESHFRYHPVPLLKSEIFKDACQRGFSYYDFSPSGGLKGVEKFKEEFGAQKMYFCSYVWSDNTLYHTYRKARNLVLRLLKGTIRATEQESQGG